MSTFTIADAESIGCVVVRSEAPALIDYRKNGAVCSFGGGSLEDALAQVAAWAAHRKACGAVDTPPVGVVSS